MSATWKVGKVEQVMMGADGFVQEVVVSYKDTGSDTPEDWNYRALNWPVRNMVKLFNVEDTNLMEEIKDAWKLAQDILEGKKMYACPEGSGDGLPSSTTDGEVGDTNLWQKKIIWHKKTFDDPRL